MTKAGRKRKPGHDHLIPQAAWLLRPERQVTLTRWQDLESYAGYQSWSGARWAWEFLRRNRFFQRDCDLLNKELQKKTKKRPKLDAKWLLHEFKCYDEPFSLRGMQPSVPKWRIFSRVECWDSNTPIRLKRPPQPWDVDDLVLQPGQVAIVLDVNNMASLPSLLDMQWSVALQKVAASALRLAKAEETRKSKASDTPKNAALKKISVPHRDKRIDYLRIADAFSGPFPANLQEVCETFHGQGRLQSGESEGTNSEFSLQRAKNSLYKMIAASRSVIYEQGYLLLVEEDAAKATSREMLAPYWPMSAPNNANLDDSWGGAAKQLTPDSTSPFASLFRRQKS